MIEQSLALAGLLGLDVQNPNMWEFQFSSIDNDISTIEVYRAIDISIPFHHFDITTRKTGSKHYSEWDPEGPFSITFWETTDFKVLKALESWKEQVYSTETRTWGLGDNTKNGLLTFGDNNFQDNFYIYFYRMKIVGFDDFALNYTDQNGFTIKANFTADRVTVTNMAVS